MNARQSALIEEYLSLINPSYRPAMRELAEYAVSLGYTPTRCKTQDLTIDFRNAKQKRTIMKLEQREQSHDGFAYGERDVPGLRLKFYASAEYSEVFQNAVKRVIENFGGKYTGCYGCGRCTGKKQGYVYAYPDGRKVFRCGGELLSVFDFLDHVDEAKRLLQRQAEAYAGGEAS